MIYKFVDPRYNSCECCDGYRILYRFDIDIDNDNIMTVKYTKYKNSEDEGPKDYNILYTEMFYEGNNKLLDMLKNKCAIYSDIEHTDYDYEKYILCSDEMERLEYRYSNNNISNIDDIFYDLFNIIKGDVKRDKLIELQRLIAPHIHI